VRCPQRRARRTPRSQRCDSEALVPRRAATAPPPPTACSRARAATRPMRWPCHARSDDPTAPVVPQVSFMEASALNGGNVEAAFLQARADSYGERGGTLRRRGMA